jgi:ATP-binding cassette subfamily F protein uup
MDTLDMLQELLSDYDGTLILVSHDRDFLDRTVTEVLAFEGSAQVEAHLGGYSDYQAAKKQAAQPRKPASEPMKEAPAAPPARTKLSFKFKRERETLPARILALEEELASLRALLSDPQCYTRDPQRFDEATARYAEAQEALAQAETRWLELEEMAGANT